VKQKWNKKPEVKYYGIGFIGLLQIALIVLKLVGVIHCGWFIVLLPIIISLSFKILLFILAIIISLF